MSLLPIFLRLERRPVLVVGAGTVALAKIESLRSAGAYITVVAPAATPQLQELIENGELTWHQRVFSPSDLDGTFLVIAATNDSAVNHAVYEEALRRNVLCNAVDDPPNCDFYFGSVVTICKSPSPRRAKVRRLRSGYAAKSMSNSRAI
jgi:precorrin-2 dehydrogenase/sirohydrochlorin ferrochelatase